MRTVSDIEYAQAVRGTATRSDIEWLHRHFRGDALPKLPAFKAGRKWRATEDQVEQAIELLTAATGTVPAVPSASSMTRTSRRRLAS